MRVKARNPCVAHHSRMVEYMQAWQCIGCGRIEAPQRCIGVCKDRKVQFIGRAEHERVLDDNAALREQLRQVRERLARFASTTPRDGQWQRCWESARQASRDVLAIIGTVD